MANASRSPTRWSSGVEAFQSNMFDLIGRALIVRDLLIAHTLV
jgi:hypothetical protein